VGAGAELSIVGLAKERDDFASPLSPDSAAPEETATSPPPEPGPVRKTPPRDSKQDSRRPDRVFLPHAKDPIPIRPSSAEMFILQQLRDEAHRFAIGFHRAQRRRLTLRSALASVPGIGPGRQRQLLRHFGSLKKVREASIDELQAAPGMTRPVAEAVHAHWARQPLEVPAAEASATAEELAIEDAFSSTDGQVVEMTQEYKKQEI
jgi:excinuclease ABC subunit C